MANIAYTAKRRLVNLFDDEITISIGFQQFERTPIVKKTSAESIGGVEQSTLHYFTDSWQITTMPIEAVDQPEFDEFIYSTLNKEQFTVDNIDENRVMDVTRTDTHTRTRLTSGELNFFTYTFGVREVVV